MTPAGMRKTCCTCKLEFLLDNFHASNQTPDRLNPRCRSCQAACVKRCIEKKLANGVPVVSPASAEAARARKRSYYAANPEKYRALSALNRVNHPEKVYASSRASRLKNPLAVRDYANRYYEKNAEKIRPRHASQAMKRYAGKQMATPVWADLEEIKEIYRAAAQVTAATGTMHHVDHIVPLRGRTVCGLHVACNLRVIARIENIAKGNRVWPDMP